MQMEIFLEHLPHIWHCVNHQIFKGQGPTLKKIGDWSGWKRHACNYSTSSMPEESPEIQKDREGAISQMVSHLS